MTTAPLNWRRYNERYRLEGSHCKNCDSFFFPVREICPKCRRTGKIEKTEMPFTGKIVSFTKVFVGPEGFENQVPYFLAIIELENKARLLAQLVDSPEKKIKIGARVKKVFRRIGEISGKEVINYGYKFKVV